MGGFYFFDMELPDYFITALYRHYKRIVANAKCDPADTKTANALRLAKTELQRLEKIINNGSQPL